MNIIKQEEIVTGRPCGSVAQFGQTSARTVCGRSWARVPVRSCVGFLSSDIETAGWALASQLLFIDRSISVTPRGRANIYSYIRNEITKSKTTG